MKFVSERRRRERRRRRRLAVSGVLGLASLAGGIGVVLPKEWVRTETGYFDRPPETVWRVLTDLDGMPLWRSDLVGVERLPSQEGRTVWREVGSDRTRVLEQSVAEPPNRLVVQASRAGAAELPQRTFDLVATDRGTRVTITDRSLVSNPLGRVLVRATPRASPARRFLGDLERRLTATRQQVSAGGAP